MRRLADTTPRCATIATMEGAGERATAVIKTLLVAALAIHLHHRFKGPSIDYVGLAAAAAASWIGVPGPGEPVLIAAGVFAARHKLDLTGVLFVAWAGATAGGIVGWLIGMRAGRTFVTATGPLYRLRTSAVSHGDEVFSRYAVVAILLTPSWIAGIHKVRAAVYLPTNAAGAAIWAGGIGAAAYFVGPTVIDFVSDLGLVTAAALIVLLCSGIAAEVVRRRRRRARESP